MLCLGLLSLILVVLTRKSALFLKTHLIGGAQRILVESLPKIVSPELAHASNSSNRTPWPDIVCRINVAY